MDRFLRVFDHIRYNQLPLQYSICDNVISIHCGGWDIREIDQLIMTIGGTREGFIIKIEVKDEVSD